MIKPLIIFSYRAISAAGTEVFKLLFDRREYIETRTLKPVHEIKSSMKHFVACRRELIRAYRCLINFTQLPKLIQRKPQNYYRYLN